MSRPPSGKSHTPTEGVAPGRTGSVISKRTANIALEEFLKAQAEGDGYDIGRLKLFLEKVETQNSMFLWSKFKIRKIKVAYRL